MNYALTFNCTVTNRLVLVLVHLKILAINLVWSLG